VDVTLDNSRSEEVEAVYQVTWEDNEGHHEDAFVVPAGDVKTFLIGVAENTKVLVQVADLAQGAGASETFQVDCQPGDEPRASIGEVNCANLTVPLTLDNSRSSVERSFFVMAEQISGLELEPPYQNTFAVAGGAERVVRVPIPNNAEVSLFVEDDSVGDPFTVADETFQVDCPNTAARPTVAVEGVKLPQTGGFNLSLPLLGVAFLVGGGGMLALSGRRRQH
jgi:LPXTG-motif cell wall-anchored protein